MRNLQFVVILIIWTSCKMENQRPLKVKLDFHRPSLNKIDSIETANNGVKIYKPYEISVSKDYFPNADKFIFGTPLMFVRDTSTLRTGVTYFFSVPDSIVRLVEYSWNKTGRDKNEIDRLFKLNDSTVSKSLTKNGNRSINNQDTWSQVTDIWDTDSVHVEQFMFIRGNLLRTRVLVSWK